MDFGPWEQYLFDADRAQADALLLANGGAEESGKFLIRSVANTSDEFIIGVIYRGAATYHQVLRKGAGQPFEINRAPLDEPCVDLNQVLKFLQNKSKRWPVPLTKGVRNPAFAAAVAAPVSAPPVAAAAAAAVASSSSSSANTQWFHGDIDQKESAELLAANDGLAENGRFLLRANPANPDSLILSVVYKKTATNHLLALTPAGTISVNNQDLKVASYAEAVESLRSKHKFWPVPLTTGLLPKGSAAPVVAAAVAPVHVEKAADPRVESPAPVVAQKQQAPVSQPPPPQQQQQQAPPPTLPRTTSGSLPDTLSSPPPPLRTPLVADVSAGDKVDDSAVFKPVTAITGSLQAAASPKMKTAPTDTAEIKRLAALEAEEIRQREEAIRAESEAAYQEYKKQQFEKKLHGGSGAGVLSNISDEWRAKKAAEIVGQSNTVGEFVPGVQKKLSTKRPSESPAAPAANGNGNGASANDQCTFLGNCRCSRCA